VSGLFYKYIYSKSGSRLLNNLNITDKIFGIFKTFDFRQFAPDSADSPGSLKNPAQMLSEFFYRPFFTFKIN